jgi:hypothetical protein
MRIWPICCSHLGTPATALRPGAPKGSWAGKATLDRQRGRGHGNALLSHQFDPRMMARRSGETFVAGE